MQIEYHGLVNDKQIFIANSLSLNLKDWRAGMRIMIISRLMK